MRLAFSVLAMLALAMTSAIPAGVDYPVVRPGVALSFPKDHGAHPAFRTEWWYATGWLKTEDGKPLGFQVTFFRTRPPVDNGNPSAFAASQVLFAHAALSDPEVGRLLHGERSARAGFGIASAAEGDTDVKLRDWSFQRSADDRFSTKVVTSDFALDLAFTPTQPVFPQGDGGYSRKGAKPEDASHYYSMPHLGVSGTVTRDGTTVLVTGEAWLDREWSSNYLSADAVGWDWTGLNLDDGSALMAFRIRGRDEKTIWAGGSFRRPDGSITVLAPGDVSFNVVNTWPSPRTGAVYPIEQGLSITLPEGGRHFRLAPLFPDQELDGRASGLPVYWEGAVTTEGGRGYLELTGYASPLKM